MSDTTETETDTNTDNTDEPSKAELHDRVQKLESTVEKLMPSRRDALKLGAAGIAGAAGLGAASQSADASTGSAGTIGSSGSRPDLFADEINVNQIETPITTGSFSTFQFADSGDTRAVQGVRTTEAVSTTNKEIYNAVVGGFGTQRSNLIHVHGRDPNTEGTHFTDIVIFLQFGGATTIGSSNRGTSATRTYTENGNSLELSVSQNTFDVIVSVDGLNTG